MSVFTEQVATADHAAQATAATVESFVIGRCPFDGTLTAATLEPQAALTADATNNRTFTLVNRKADNSGTTVMAIGVTAPSGANSTGNWTAHVAVPLTLSAVANALLFSQGDILEVVETVGGTGVAHPQLAMECRGTHR